MFICYEWDDFHRKMDSLTWDRWDTNEWLIPAWHHQLHVPHPGEHMSLCPLRLHLPDHHHHHREVAGRLLPLLLPGNLCIFKLFPFYYAVDFNNLFLLNRKQKNKTLFTCLSSIKEHWVGIKVFLNRREITTRGRLLLDMCFQSSSSPSSSTSPSSSPSLLWDQSYKKYPST